MGYKMTIEQMEAFLSERELSEVRGDWKAWNDYYGWHKLWHMQTSWAYALQTYVDFEMVKMRRQFGSSW